MRTMSFRILVTPTLLVSKFISVRIKIMPTFWYLPRSRDKILIILLMLLSLAISPFKFTIQPPNNLSSDTPRQLCLDSTWTTTNLTFHVFSVNWDDYAHVLESMQAPPTEIYSAGDVILQFKHLEVVQLILPLTI